MQKEQRSHESDIVMVDKHQEKAIVIDLAIPSDSNLRKGDFISRYPLPTMVLMNEFRSEFLSLSSPKLQRALGGIKMSFSSLRRKRESMLM